MSALEALTNAVIGLIVSWLATYFILGFSAVQSVCVTLLFFCLSFVRAWVLRLIFKKMEQAK